MKRRAFVRNTLGASVGAMVFGHTASEMNRREGEELLDSISRANDRRVRELLDGYQRVHGNRGRSRFIVALAAAYCSEPSRYHRSENLIGPMGEAVEALLREQYPDGTFDSGNLQSPPDTAFMIEQLGRAQALLRRRESEATAQIRQSLQEIILSAGEALITGGVHTPNHRWAVCSALAWTHTLYPDQRYVVRIDDWLGEGIGQDADGQYSERSPNYSAHVVNPALLDVAVLLDRPELLDVVRKNLEMTVYHVDLNGEVETVASRRQDQAQSRRVLIHEYYRPYRYLAILDDNRRFAGVARDVETNYEEQLGRCLPDFLLFDALSGPLPPPVTLPRTYEKHFTHSGLVRIRRENITATVFGGSDWNLGHGVWSGLSHNPTFFKFRKGKAILESVRMAPDFFSTGYFRGNGLTPDGGAYHLREERRVPYHQPLPEAFRKASGAYEMSPDGRFFSKMDFAHRPKEYKTLRSEVTVRETDGEGAFELDIVVDRHPNVAVAIELCFRKGGRLKGVIPREDDAYGYFLDEGYGTYEVGEDRIVFGPGERAQPGFTMYGEEYSVHNGGIWLEGYRVYILGTTPFRHRLQMH